jgi:glucose-6-phosphate 1-dehydrogenase
MENSKGIEKHIFVVFGATSNLTSKKLFPALYHLSTKGELRDKSTILGVSRGKQIDDLSYRMKARDMLETSGLSVNETNRIYPVWCDECLFYQSIDQGKPENYQELSEKINSLERKKNLPENRIFYLALPPSVFTRAIAGLGESGLNQSSGWTRLVIEKPFGKDLKSAQNLNKLIHSYFDESQIYRIDHYLGKETVQNLLVFRFANAFFERLWNRDNIESVHITVAEDEGIEQRKYYDQAGALRDMIENHLTQVMTLIAMEIPAAFKADKIRDEKVKVLQQVSPIKKENIILGQYTKGKINDKEVPAYTEEQFVDHNSRTETFVDLRLEIANWRWKGVPFYLCTGKRLPDRHTRIMVKFQCAPVSLFNPFRPECNLEQNELIIRLQPDEGFDLKFLVKNVGKSMNLSKQTLQFRYSEALKSLPDAYETLLLEVIRGDQTLFVRSDEVEEAWKIYTPLFDMDLPVYNYSAGSWGPKETDNIFANHAQNLDF